MDFIGEDAHYETKPIEPEVEAVRVMREGMAVVGSLGPIVQRMERAAAVISAAQQKKARATA